MRTREHAATSFTSVLVTPPKSCLWVAVLDVSSVYISNLVSEIAAVVNIDR